MMQTPFRQLVPWEKKHTIHFSRSVHLQFIFWLGIGLLKEIVVPFLILKIRKDAHSLLLMFFKPLTFKKKNLQTVAASI